MEKQPMQQQNPTIPTILFFSIVGFCMFLTPAHVAMAGLTTGLVGHWTFDGKDTTWTSATTGTTRDISGNGNTGTLFNMSRASAPAIGRIGQALQYDGSNDYVNVPDSPSLALTTEATFSFWFKPNSLATYQRIMGNFGVGELIGQSFGDDVCIHTFAGDTVCTTGTFLRLNTWTYVTMTFSDANNESHFYRDGRHFQTVANNNTVTGSGASFSIGGTGFFVNGALDDVRVYNRVLTATEIQQLYTQGATKLGVTPARSASSTGLSSGLVGHWTFDGKDINWSTKTMMNRGLSGNTGTLTNLYATTAPRIGKLAQGLFIPRNGTDAEVFIGDNPQLINDFSFSFWVYPTLSVNQATFISNYNGFGNPSFSVYDSSFFFVFRAGGGTINAPKLTPGKWYYITAVRDSILGSTYLYRDGILVGSTTPGTVVGPLNYGLNGNLALGNDSGTVTEGSCGCILDDVRVYNRVLTATEIQQLYTQGATKLGVTPARSASSTGLSSGLVGHWTFDGKDTTWTSATTGTTRDISGNGNTGTLTSMNRSTSTVVGKVGQGFKFDSVARIATANSSIIGTNAPNGFSLFTWFKRSDLVSEYLMEYGGSGAATIQTNTVNQGEVYCRMRDTVFGFVASPITTLAPSKQWRFIGCVYDPLTSTLSLYVDGKHASTSNVSNFSTFNNPGNFFLGGRTYGTSGTTGMLDDMRIYNRPLSGNEIEKLYKLGQTRIR